MTEVIDSTTAMERAPAMALARKISTEDLADELMERAQSDGVSLVGPGGLLADLTKRVLEAMLEGEMTDHVGYAPHDPAGHHSGNSRNGTRTKTVITEIGPVEIEVPRDRAGTFEPMVVPKRRRRLGGVDQMVLSLSAKGLTHGEISAHLEEIYEAKVSKETVTRITDGVLETMVEWQNRPLDAVYPVLFIDAINVKIREGHVQPACPPASRWTASNTDGTAFPAHGGHPITIVVADDTTFVEHPGNAGRPHAAVNRPIASLHRPSGWSRSYVLASLRALHLDQRLRPGAPRQEGLDNRGYTGNAGSWQLRTSSTSGAIRSATRLGERA